MTKAPAPISIRLGRSGNRALEDLARMRGVTKAEAARQAIEEAAARERRRRGLGEEARRLMADPAYAAEIVEVADLMEELRGQG